MGEVRETSPNERLRNEQRMLLVFNSVKMEKCKWQGHIRQRSVPGLGGNKTRG